jgi:hypothetical protein
MSRYGGCPSTFFVDCQPMILVHIVNQLNDPDDVLSLCQVNPCVRQVFKCEDFWMGCVANRFVSQGQLKPVSISWREYYLQLLWSTVSKGLSVSSVRQEWIYGGQLHRLHDLPAVIGADGTREWYQHGQHHRDGDQPAVIRPSGTREWYQHGQHHRDGDQPAIIWVYGGREWSTASRWGSTSSNSAKWDTRMVS